MRLGQIHVRLAPENNYSKICFSRRSDNEQRWTVAFCCRENSVKKLQPEMQSRGPTYRKRNLQWIWRKLMLHMAALFINEENLAGVGLWLFLAIGAISLFGIFLPLSTWVDARRKEREAYYKAETIRRVAESSADGAKAAMELLREQSRIEQLKRREGVKIGGLVNFGIGVALVFFLRSLLGPDSPYLCGLIPAAIGAALLIYVYFMAEPVH